MILLDDVKVRQAHVTDWPAIQALIRSAGKTLPVLWDWEAHLTDECFVVADKENRLVGAFLASSDETPVAWVRLAAAADALDIRRWLALSLPPILERLRIRGVHELAWMDHAEWAAPYLETHGFRRLAEVVTLAKTIHEAPRTRRQRIVTLRAGSVVDAAAIAAIDRAAFTRYWWRSEATVRRRAATPCRFTVAECKKRVVGYAELELQPPAAHLNRIAVAPDYQEQGIGASLMSSVLHSLWRSGAQTVSLNTQRHNARSRRLYERFGFSETGDAATVWTLRL